jgi:ABC-type nickel/cobalt efflux system permease component RcnA
MGYLRNHLATVVTACFAIFLTGMYFYMPQALHQLLLVATIVTWFLVFICWISQRSADWTKKYGSHSHTDHSQTHSHEHSHEEKKSSTRLTNISVEELNKFRDSFTAELNELKDEVKLKDNEIARMRQEIANLETLMQIEALKAELANLKAVAAKRK